MHHIFIPTWKVNVTGQVQRSHGKVQTKSLQPLQVGEGNLVHIVIVSFIHLQGVHCKPLPLLTDLLFY